MKIVGHKSEKMWKRYNSIEEKDLTDAAVKVQKYLDVNTLYNTKRHGRGRSFVQVVEILERARSSVG